MLLVAPAIGAWQEVIYAFVVSGEVSTTWFVLDATGAGAAGFDLFIDAFTLEQLP